MTRVVLDPNVLISAVLSRQGAPALLVKRCLEGELELIVSDQLLAELERALVYPKLRERVTAEEAAAYVELVRRSAELALDIAEPPRRAVDPGDDYLVALAAQERAALVTGDRHLLELAKDLPIYTPRELLGLID